eukprot:TRINITY_DN6557_c2_g1_i2.p1 TRINITY_DN6557_c2_g1~~TRINITY_DN6557_c2_g1_i2.p1  ORF type:complete len:605 (+),score=90.14 TRINITY_DN6557_c2_g1_i2:102-1817(+)
MAAGRPLWRRLLRGCTITLVGTGSVGAVGFAAWRYHYERTRTPERHVPNLVDNRGHLTAQDVRVSHFAVFVRYVQLCMIYAPLFLLYPLNWLGESGETLWHALLLRCVELSGPAFIKLAQWLATRRDLASPKVRRTLSLLFNQVSPHCMAHNRRVVHEDFGHPIDVMFSEFDEKPVGSGSIAQVHRARLADNPELLGELAGKRVAVKIAHPRIVERIAVDFHVLNRLAQAVDWMFPSMEWLDLRRQTLAWTEYLAQQIDLGLEARNLEYFRENFKDTDDQVFCCFPKPFRPFVSQRVLVEEFIDGRTADYEWLETLTHEYRHHIADIGMESYVKCLLRDNWLHGDMHPGNIMVAHEAEPGKKWPKVYLVDCGLCLKLNPEQGELSRKMIGGYARWKPDQVSEAFWEMGPDGTQKFCDRDSFVTNMRQVMGFYQSSSGKDKAVIGRCLESCFDVVRDHKVQLEGWATNLLFGVLVSESFIMTLDDQYNIVKAVLPWLAAEGHFGWGMFRNQFGWVPWFAKEKDRSKEIAAELKAKGQLQVEGEYTGWGSEAKHFQGGVLGAERRSLGTASSA